MTDGQTLTPRDIAARWKVNPRTVIRWINKGDLAAERVGRQWRVPESSWSAFLASCRHGPAD